MASSGGKEASNLAATGSITRTDYIARSTIGYGTSVDAEVVEQFRQIEPRQVKQVSTGTAGVTANFIARTTSGIARTASSIAWTTSGITRAALVEATAIQIQTKSAEQVEVTKRELR